MLELAVKPVRAPLAVSDLSQYLRAAMFTPIVSGDENTCEQ
jgi:hypothetical protein